jgi:tetratricopeptide (TPR) repeat protein
MKNKILILFFIALSVFKGMAQGQKNMGQWYLDETQYQKARSFFLKQLQSNPSDVNTCNLLGDAYLGLNKQDSAKIMYQKAFALNPKDPFVLVNLGKIALLEGNREAELDFFDKARKQDRKNPEVYCRIAESCFDLSKKDTITGNTYLNMGMDLNSKYPCFHMVKGDWEAYLKNYGKAANAYERAIFFDPNNIIALRKLGEIYAAARFNRQSLDTYTKCIQIEPNQILVYKDMGDLFYSLGRYAEAEKNYDIYLSKADVNLNDKEKYAIILFFNKKYNESAQMLEDVIKQNKETNQGVLLRIRGYIAYETGDFKKGLDYMNKFFQVQDPKRIIASDYLYYGRLLEKNNLDAQAMESYKKALAMDSTKTEIYDNLANLAHNNKLYPEAIKYYYKMIENGADKVNVTYTIGKEAYFEGSRYSQMNDSLMELHKKGALNYKDSTAVRDSMHVWYLRADSAFATVTRLSPDYSGGYMWKGRMDNYLDPNQEKEDAKNSYEKALSLMEKDPAKYKSSIVEAYKFLGSYYYINGEKINGSDKAKAEEYKKISKDYWTKILELDPNDKKAKLVIEQMNEASKRPAVKQKK